MDTKFFSLETATGTARAIVYWDRLNEQEKADILFTAHHPDPSFLEMILQEGDPLHIEIAFRWLLSFNFRKPKFNSYIDLVPRAIDVIESQWNKRLGFTPWSAGVCPINLAVDFYTWVRGESTEGPCEEIEVWANEFCTYSQLQRKVIVERSHFFASVGVLAACLKKRKLSCLEAFDLFKAAIAHHDQRYEADEEWSLTWDDGMVLSAFLSAMAVEEKNYPDESWSLLADCITVLHKFVILEESVEPFLPMHPRALTLMLLLGGGAHGNLKELRRRLIKLVLEGDSNACPPSVRWAILRSEDGWQELLSQCSNRSDALRFALGSLPIPLQWRDWGEMRRPKDFWLSCGLGLFSARSGAEWISNLDHLDDRQRRNELAEMACLCEALVASGGRGWYVDNYQDCDLSKSSYDYSHDEAVVSGDIVSTYQNLLSRDPCGRQVGRWRKWRTHMDRKYCLTDRLIA